MCQRWEQFIDFLGHLLGTWEFPHGSLTFIQPCADETTVMFVEETLVDEADLHSVSPVNNVDDLLT